MLERVSFGKQLLSSQRAATPALQNSRAQSSGRCCRELLEKIRKCLFHARGILDFYARDFQSQNRKTHRNAVIIVGLDFRPVKRGPRWKHCEGVVFFPPIRSAPRQFSAQGGAASAFLQPQAPELGEA